MGREARLNAALSPVERQERNIVRLFKKCGNEHELDGAITYIVGQVPPKDRDGTRGYLEAVAEEHVTRFKPSWVRDRERAEVHERIEEIKIAKQHADFRGSLTQALDAAKNVVGEGEPDADAPALDVTVEPGVEISDAEVIEIGAERVRNTDVLDFGSGDIHIVERKR